MTIGTAMVASTNVRTIGVSGASQSPRARLSTVRVGKTASQIMRASWCLLGGPGVAGRDVGAGPGVDAGFVIVTPSSGRGWRIGRGGRGRGRGRRRVRRA